MGTLRNEKEIKEEMMTNIEDRDKEPVEEDDGDANIGSGPPWVNKRGASKGGNHTPVESYEAHAQAVSDSKDLVDLDIVGGDPANP